MQKRGPEHKSSVEVLPIGNVDPELIVWLRNALTERIAAKVTVGDPIEAPSGAFDNERKQYIGDGLLAVLREISHPPSRGIILGIIDADCYSANLQFVFGQAVLKGHEAYLALSRLRGPFEGALPSRKKFRERVLKEAVHELGHTFGLTHCPNSS